MGWIVAIIVIIAVLALLVYPPLYLLALLVGVGAIIHYFATNKSSKESAFAFVLLLIGLVIVGGLYAKFGAIGAVIGFFAIIVFIGVTS